MKALVEAALVGTTRQPDRARDALRGDSPVDALIRSSLSVDMIAIPRLASLAPNDMSHSERRAEGPTSRNRDLPFDGAVAAERSLLLAAAAHDTYRRAGRMPRTDLDALPPAKPEIAPGCAPAVAALLADLLAIRPRVLLAEALARLRGAGVIVAPALLPDLLDTRDPLLAEVLPHVIGERGRWLVALTGGDDWLVDDTPDPAEARRVWDEDRLPRRLAVFRARRYSDPADARAWVDASWSAESAEHRAQILGVLAETLGPDDAAFLEQALADRSANVRAVAARLLARLPHTETARRFAARADAMLDYDAPSTSGLRARVGKAVGLAMSGTLTVHPPEQWDPVWERDGIAAKPPRGSGERAYWLVESLALVAPEHWTQRFDADPRTLIRAALNSEWSIPVLLGWSQAAIAVGDETWAAALWDAWRDDVNAGDATTIESSVRGNISMALLRAMSRDDAELRTLSLMRRASAELPIGLAVLVHVVPAPFSAAHSRRFLTELAPLLSAAAASQWTPGTWFESLEPIAMRLAPETFDDALALERDLSSADTLPPAYRRKLDEFRDVVRLRQRIHEEIPGEPARR